MRLLRHTLVMLLTAVLLMACGGQPATEPLPDTGGAIIAAESRLLAQGSGQIADGEIAPDFSYTLPDGTTVRLSDHQGQPVLLNFWATWCLPCIEEMPAIERVYSEAAGALVVLAVNRNELPAAIARFAPSVNVSFPLIADLSGSIGDHYRVTSLPTTFFIASDGTIAGRHIGALSEQQLAERLSSLP
ncbi:MAG: TlpA family protein disulfide reductase [Oscillochloridaceae bacterium umkhey_bin13]